VSVDATSGCGAFSIVANGGPRTLAPGDSVVVTVGIVTTAGGHFTCAIATGAGLPDVSVVGDVLSASFTTDLAPILSSRCRSCHIPWSRAYLLANNAFFPCQNLHYVVPYDPGSSAIYLKLTSPPCGSRMPQSGGFLSSAQTDLFRR